MSLTIGYIIPNLVGDYHRKQWAAVNKTAIKAGVNLVLFSPFMFYSHYAFKNEFFKTFQFAHPKNIDGLIVSSGSLNVFCDSEELNALCNSYKPLPIVSIAEQFKGIPSILIDNKQGMYDLVEHFIQKHNYKKIAFLRGPKNNQEAEIRYEAYKEALAANNIPLDPEIIIRGDFGLHSGKTAVAELIDDRKVSFDAIIAANDDMILGAVSELKARGIKVPQQVALAGFDDIESVKDANPPISSVEQPFGEQAEKATEMLIRMIQGEEVPEVVILKAKPRIRESCGCELEKKKEITGENVDRKMISKIKNLENTAKGYNVGNLSAFYNTLMNALDHNVIYSELEKLLLKVEIPSCYLSFYKKNGSPRISNDPKFPPSKAELVFAYKDNKRIEIKTKKFNPLNLVSDTSYLKDKRRSLICTELLFQHEHYGFIIFELTASMDPLIFQLLLLQLTSCLQSIFIHKELEVAIHKLKEMDKAKTHFFANISHEFRTPLTLILSPLESIVQGDYGNTIDCDDVIFQAMLRNGFRLSKLINSLLDFTKIEAGKMKAKKQKTDVVKLLTFYTSSIYSGAESLGIQVKFINKAGHLIGWLDRDLIEKAFFNLISNALKFTPPGGTVTIFLTKEEQYFHIIVEDTGIGIKKEKIDKIFERFSQADEGMSRKYEGTGIGLSFTKEIVKLHKGKIIVTSETDKGSTFTISLPMAREEDMEDSLDEAIEDIPEIKAYLMSDLQKGEDVKESEQRELEEPEQPENKKNSILVCDDNYDIRKFLKSFLEKEYHIITAKDGREGLEKVRKYNPTLVLSDVMMPEMSGYELCDAIKKDPKLQHIPVILITAKADVSMKIEGFEYGADDYLSKPFNSKEMLLRVRVFINREELRRQLEEKNQLLANLAKQDSLTGLLNHGAVQSHLQTQFDLSRKKKFPISVVMMDIDYFKRVNDTYGHQMGDKVIQEVGAVLSSKFGNQAIKGRYGGDEFVVILPHFGKDEIEDAFNRLYKGIKDIRLYSNEGEEIKVTTSIGISVLESNAPCEDHNHLLELADKALYIVKERGRDQGCILEYNQDEIFI